MRSLLARLAFLSAFVSAALQAQQNSSVTVCQELEDVILHPTTYVQEKARKQGLSCLLQPHCCTPAWILSPDCYVWKWVKGQDAWEEVQKTVKCENYTLSAEDALEKWLNSFYDLIPVRIIPAELTALFGGYVGLAYDVANPLPDDVKARMRELAKAGYPFTETNIEQARWLQSDHPLARRIWPSGNLAITYYNLIIVAPYPFITGERCLRMSEWAHELVHVHQYNQEGFDLFIYRFLEEGATKDGESIRYEMEAEYWEAQELCDCTRGTTNPPKSTLVACQNFKQLTTLLSNLSTSNAITIGKGQVSNVSPEVLRRLEERIPGARVGVAATGKPPKVRAKGRLVIDQTAAADLDKGRVISGSEADIWFQAETPKERYLTPQNGASIAKIGWASPGRDGCAAAPLRDTRIAIAELPVGTYVCVQTASGHYSELRVTAPVGQSPGKLSVNYTTWDPI